MDERDRVTSVSHLASCGSCRERLIFLFDVAGEKSSSETLPLALKTRAVQLASVESTSKSYFSFFRPYVPVALAAMILLAVGLSLFLFQTKNENQRQGEFRQSDGASSEISLTSPAKGATVNSGILNFRWSDAGGGARYEFTLTDEKGDILFQDKTATSPLSMDTAAVRLLPQRKYYWSVTARLPDGTRRESGIASFNLK